MAEKGDDDTKTKLALFFGGASQEYAVSLCSAAAVLRALDGEKYEIYTIGIDRAGHWLLTEAGADAIENDSWQGRSFPCFLSPDRGMPGLWLFRPGEAVRRILPDVLLPVLHGQYGEDGRIQGLFALSGIPYVGCGTEASAVGMNKATCKLLARAAGIPVVPWVSLSGGTLRDAAQARRLIEGSLRYPIFIKPCRAGSSVGAARVDRAADLPQALAEAASIDDCVLAESYLTAREIEVAVLEAESGLEISRPGEITPPKGDFYSYEAKYGNTGATLTVPAALSPWEERRVRDYAGRLFALLGCRGGVRVDFFLTRGTQQLYFNEINTLPGFTPISMFPRLLTEGRTMGELLDTLIAGARP